MGKIRILIVEDHADTAAVLEVVLRKRGYEVTTTGTAAEALALCEESKFDLLITDIGLPDYDGWELLKRVREKCKVKAIALTGFGMASDVRHSREAGFDAHLTKPADLSSVVGAIEKVMKDEPHL
jgi:CheY-like chemotaxis protein